MTSASIRSVNVGLPRDVPHDGGVVRTAIFKSPVPGRTAVGSLGLEGDGQANLTVHGGVDKAVYAYPVEHYAFWQEIYPDKNLTWGTFGENLTTVGLRETECCIGDRWRIGSVELVISEPRMPCANLGIRLADPGALKIFLENRRSGFYLRVVQPGDVAAGDSITLLDRGADGLCVEQVVALRSGARQDADALRHAARCAALPEKWRRLFSEKLAKLTT